MFETIITDFFMWCVYILQVVGGSPGEYGFGYYLANIFIFVILQPFRKKDLNFERVKRPK